MAELKLNDEQVNAALQAAILAAIGDIGRERIIKEAVSYLIANDTRFKGQVSPLMEIVQNAAREIAKTILTDKLATDETFTTEVHRLYEDAVKKMFDVATREKLVERLANKMAEGLEKDRY
jgi:fructose-1,6-bisphosphatase